MKLCIPSLGTLIRLKKDWQFKLFLEGRNATVLAGFIDGGSKKVDIPSSYSYYYVLHPPTNPHPWHARDKADWDNLMESCRDAGYQVVDEPASDVDSYNSYKTKDRVPYISVILPKGTMLAFDRYYIRQGAEAFDSVTFKIESCPDANFAKNKNTARRFWARLPDVNNIDCDVVG